jgi:hypothetical protein
MAALVDQELVAGRFSAAVKGHLSRDEALRILLAGNGLSVHFTSEDAFTVEPSERTTVQAPMANITRDGLRDRRSYFADLQDSLTRTLCRSADARPGLYRLGLQLWIGTDGSVLASHLLDSTGDDRRDAAIVEVVGSAVVAAPPPQMPQPVTVVLRGHPESQSVDCR